MIAAVVMAAGIGLTGCASTHCGCLKRAPEAKACAEHAAAIEAQRQSLEDAHLAVRARNAMRARSLSIGAHRVNSAAASIPHAELVTFPQDHPEITTRRTQP